MAPPWTNAWDETKPADADLANTLGTSGRQLRLDIRQRLDWQHVWGQNTSDDGGHRFVLIASTYHAVNTSSFKASGFSLTAANAQPFIDLAGTWNTSGAPTALKLNVVDTASDANSLLLDLQVGGVSKFKVDKAGNVTIPGTLSIAGIGIPAGVISPYGGSSAPSGYLLCDGSAVSRTTYATLFAIISTTYGVGDSSTTFNVPNLQGRFPLGKDGSHALATTGGQIDHTHTVSAHTHTVAVAGTTADAIGGPAQTFNYGGGVAPSGTFSTNGHTHTFSTTPTTSSSGGGATTSANPPFQVVNYIIKT